MGELRSDSRAELLVLCLNFLGVLGEGCAECRPHYKATSRRTLGKGGTPSASNQGTKDPRPL